jgi:hypothetical protein
MTEPDPGLPELRLVISRETLRELVDMEGASYHQLDGATGNVVQPMCVVGPIIDRRTGTISDEGGCGRHLIIELDPGGPVEFVELGGEG